MQITHQEARHLIQFRADRTLSTNEKELLNIHLKDCFECRGYVNEIQETETTLRTVLRKHLNVYFLPLQVKAIWAESVTNQRVSYLTTRSAMIGATLLLFIFAFWQFTTTNSNSSIPMTVGVPAIPTPSLILTSTQNDFANCQLIHYNVQQGDTLESLARQFSASEETIRDFNQLQVNVATLPAKLTIPVCRLTPTGTTHPPLFTDTPSLEPSTYTPG